MASYFIRRGSICKGPFSDQKIRSLLKEKKLRPTDEVAQTKDGPWSTVGLLFGNATEARGAKPLNYDETDFQNSEEAPTQSVFNTRGSVEDHRDTDAMNVEPYAIDNSPLSSSEIPDTIPCRRCGRLVGIEVDQCMECGTHNKWVHPKVERLINNVESIEWGEYKELNWQWTRTSILIYGTRETKFGKTMNIAGTLVLIGLIMFLFNPMIAITIIVAAFFGMAISAISMKSVVEILEMRVDFSTVPPVWNCNDGEFFKPVVRLLDLGSSKGTEEKIDRSHKRAGSTGLFFYGSIGVFLLIAIGVLGLITYFEYTNPYRIAENVVLEYFHTDDRALRNLIGHYVVRGSEKSSDGKSTLVYVTHKPPKIAKNTMYDTEDSFYVIVENDARVIRKEEYFATEEEWVMKFNPDSSLKTLVDNQMRSRNAEEIKLAVRASEITHNDSHSEKPHTRNRTSDDLIALTERIKASLTNQVFVRHREVDNSWIKFRVNISSVKSSEISAEEVELAFSIFFYWAPTDFKTKEEASAYSGDFNDPDSSTPMRVRYSYIDGRWNHLETKCYNYIDGEGWSMPAGFVHDPVATTILAAARK